MVELLPAAEPVIGATSDNDGKFWIVVLERDYLELDVPPLVHCDFIKAIQKQHDLALLQRSVELGLADCRARPKDI